MKRRHLFKVGLLNLLLLAGVPVASGRVVRYVERDGWILRPDDE